MTYTFDDAGQRQTMTVAGQVPVTYDWDEAGRLLSITQAGSSVTNTYDDAGRVVTATMPNGIVATYGYDDASRMTSISYVNGGTPVGDLVYAYDATGRRSSVSGSLARTGLPAAVTSATYDAANRLATWGSTTVGYDLNGNVVSEGSAGDTTSPTTLAPSPQRRSPTTRSTSRGRHRRTTWL